MFKAEQNFVTSFKVGKAYFNRIQIPDKAALYNTEESIELSKQEGVVCLKHEYEHGFENYFGYFFYKPWLTY